MKRLFPTLLLLLFGFYALAQDGPYVIYNANNVEVVSFNKKLKPSSRSYKTRHDVKPLKVVSEKGNYKFHVPLHDSPTPEHQYAMPERILVLSDPHGDITPLVKVLQGAGVIDKNLEWSFGKNQLVVLGDVADRGKDVTAIYWLIYKLEAEALKAGGCVHMLLGNHEVMVAQADLRYVQKKYTKGAEAIDATVDELWDETTELGRWLLSRNLIEQIGDNLFVHAGLSSELVNTGLDIAQINAMVRKSMAMPRAEVKKSPLPALVMGTPGPLWFRGLVNSEKKPQAVSVEEFTKIRAHFGVDRVFVGHTIHPEVTSYYDGKLIAVNVESRHNLKNDLTRAVMITPTDTWAIGTDGRRMEFDKQ